MYERNTFGSLYGRESELQGPCPHGDDPDYCDKGACDEGWNY